MAAATQGGGGVKTIARWLYVGRSASDPTIQFVMERIDDDSHAVMEEARLPQATARQRFWAAFVGNDYRQQPTYRTLSSTGKIPKNKPGFIHMVDRELNYTAGLESFSTSLNYSHHSQLWIAFVTPIPVNTIADLEQRVSVNDIEMAVPVMTHDWAPITTHMGIQRSFAFMLRAYYEAAAIHLHGGLAVPLHSFAAKVILMLHPKKLYMISAPVVVMRDLFVKALPPHDVFVGDSRDVTQAIFAQQPHPELEALQEEITFSEQKVARQQRVLQYAIDNNTPVDVLQRMDANVEEVEAELKQLKKAYSKQKNQELRALELLTVLTPNTTPLRLTKLKDEGKYSDNYKTTILSRDRTEVVFEANDQTGEIISNGVLFRPPDDTKRFGWFFHRDLLLGRTGSSAFKFLTANLDALARFLVLQPVQPAPQSFPYAIVARRNSRFLSRHHR